ncbi:MAG: anthranilate synthase component I [Methanosarcinaceae archaeon]|nr:anthranilate synthase component I [Methanosarcinaceae archaeon]
MFKISFDIDKEEFVGMVREAGTPVLVQLMAKVSTECSPLQLYTTMQNADCSYMLESVEKEKRHARFSFVGSDPDLIVSIKDRDLTLTYPENSELVNYIRSKLGSLCVIVSDNPGVLQTHINEGTDVLDAFRAVFPTANGTHLLNQKRFDRQTFLGGAIGYNGYDIVYDCWLDIEKEQESGIPDMQFALTTKTFVFDHLTGETYIVVTPFMAENNDIEAAYDRALSDAQELYEHLELAAETKDDQVMPQVDELKSAPVCNIEQAEFEDAVRTAKQHIIDGDIFQVVLSRRYSVKMGQTPLQLYRTLRNINPSPYMYIFKFGDLSIVGASPETLMTVHRRNVITNPIAGTCPRGKSETEDYIYSSKMLTDEKECAEHVMLVDLGRNDVRMVAQSGTVKVEDFMSVVKYSHLQHIESTVCGTLRDECDQFDATRAIFPAGTLSGAPKIRAMEIIDALEPDARGIYGGGVGYYSWNGDADFAIVIRTVIVKGDTAYIQAGAGIVADSDPTYEYEETERKMAAMISAIGGGK